MIKTTHFSRRHAQVAQHHPRRQRLHRLRLCSRRSPDLEVVPEEQSEFADSSFVRGKENKERGRLSGLNINPTF